jgi:chromosome partitioning protein
MKTLVVNNQKGGVGKTMLAVHAAWFLAEAGARVLFVDLDPQGNGSYSLADARQAGPGSDLFFAAPRGIDGTLGVTLFAGDRGLDRVDGDLAKALLNFRGAFGRLAGQFDYAVLDTPPTWSGRNYAALMVASSLVSPIDLETYALQGVKQLWAQKATVEKAARAGRPIDFLGLLPSRFQSNSPRQRENLAGLLREQGARIMFPDQAVLTQRQGYAEALDLRQPVWTLKKTAAQDAGREIRRVLAAIKSRLDAVPA